MKLFRNIYHYAIGMLWLTVLATTKFVNVKGKTFDKLKSKVEYRIGKMY